LSQFDFIARKPEKTHVIFNNNFGGLEFLDIY